MSHQEFYETIERVHQWIEENKVKATWLDAIEIFEDEYANYLYKNLSSNIRFEEWMGLAHPEVEIID